MLTTWILEMPLLSLWFSYKKQWGLAIEARWCVIPFAHAAIVVLVLQSRHNLIQGCNSQLLRRSCWLATSFHHVHTRKKTRVLKINKKAMPMLNDNHVKSTIVAEIWTNFVPQSYLPRPLDIGENSKKTKTLAKKKHFLGKHIIHFKRICFDLVSILRCETLYDARILRYAISKGCPQPKVAQGLILISPSLER